MNQGATNNSLCKECSLLDYDQIQEDRYVLKPSWAALVKSGEDGCQLCRLIVHNSRDARVGVDENAGDDQVLCTRGFVIIQKSTKHNPERLFSFIEPLSAANDPLPNLGRERPLAQDVNSETCFRFINSWLERCRTEHPACTGSQELRAMPARLINVLPVKASNNVRLELTEGRCGEWLTLSHCWGGTSPLKTTLKNIQSRCQIILWKDLPLTFQDAVTITRRLGFQYLWIDSLCILQDSEDDWRTHSAIMGQIYKHSTLCIVAEMTPDSYEGIFAPANVVRRENHIVLPYFSDSLKLRGEVCARFPMRGDMYEWGGPLSRRAWTLQESTMANRIVRYGKEQIYLRCPSGQLAESRPNWLDPSNFFDRDHRKTFGPLEAERAGEIGTSQTDQLSTKSQRFSEVEESTTLEQSSANEESETNLCTKNAQFSVKREYFKTARSIASEESPAPTTEVTEPSTPTNISNVNQQWSATEQSNRVSTTSERLDSWYRMIDDFARRRLTYDTDRLPAIAGVATEVQAILGYQYICGLWLGDIHWGLLWRARGRAITPKDFVAPSWSWASIVVKPNEIRNEYDKYERHDFPIYRRSAQERLPPKALEATILQVDVKNVVDNPFLQVISGALKIRNYCQLLSSLLPRAQDFDENFVLKFNARDAANVESQRRILIDFDSTEDREAPPFDARQGVMLFLITQWTVKHTPGYYRILFSKSGEQQPDWTDNILYTLILEPTGDTRGYRRIGIAEIPEEMFILENWDLRDVNII